MGGGGYLFLHGERRFPGPLPEIHPPFPGRRGWSGSDSAGGQGPAPRLRNSPKKSQKSPQETWAEPRRERGRHRPPDRSLFLFLSLAFASLARFFPFLIYCLFFLSFHLSSLSFFSLRLCFLSFPSSFLLALALFFHACCFISFLFHSRRSFFLFLRSLFLHFFRLLSCLLYFYLCFLSVIYSFFRSFFFLRFLGFFLPSLLLSFLFFPFPLIYFSSLSPFLSLSFPFSSSVSFFPDTFSPFPSVFFSLYFSFLYLFFPLVSSLRIFLFRFSFFPRTPLPQGSHKTSSTSPPMPLVPRQVSFWGGGWGVVCMFWVFFFCPLLGAFPRPGAEPAAGCSAAAGPERALAEPFSWGWV